MRVLSSKVKRLMLLFGVVALGCLGAVGACVGKVVATQSDRMPLPPAVPYLITHITMWTYLRKHLSAVPGTSCIRCP